jgi:hypothetical protein
VSFGVGDGMLVEFASVVDAVHAAVETQQAVIDHNADVPADKRIEFRIGINLGDVVIDGDDKARAKTVAVPTAAIELINLFICLSSLFKQNPSPGHTSPKGHFTGPVDTYRVEYASSGLPKPRMHADLP